MMSRRRQRAPRRTVLERARVRRRLGLLATALAATQRELTDGRAQGPTNVQGPNLDTDGYAVFCTNARGTIETWGRAASRQLGYSAAEVVGVMTPLAFHDAGEITARAAELSSELGREVEVGLGVLTLKAGLGKPGVPHEREWTYVSRDARRAIMRLSVTALRDPEGALTGFLYVGRDVTRRKEIERLKKEFISTVSHELRTPLTSIRGALGLLEGGALGALSEPAREIIQIARFNSERLIRLVNDILDLEKIDAGRMELTIEELDPAELVAATLKEIRTMADSAGVTLTAEVEVHELVRADRDRIAQVITNLLSNALKFSSPGRVVLLTVRAGAPGRLRFEVTDQGPGIPTEHLEKLFGRFQQLDSSDSRQKGGTGLGLAISKAIVEHHGGEIGVDSRSGVGSTFWFELPRAIGPVLHEPESPRLLTALRGAIGGRRTAQVLVVDDDASARAVLVTQLAKLGVDCVEAADGAQAVHLARAKLPDLIILDLVMLGMDGFQVVEILRREPSCATPLLVYTARDTTVADRQRLTLGPTKHFTKARASEEELLAAVESLLEVSNS